MKKILVNQNKRSEPEPPHWTKLIQGNTLKNIGDFISNEVEPSITGGEAILNYGQTLNIPESWSLRETARWPYDSYYSWGIIREKGHPDVPLHDENPPKGFVSEVHVTIYYLTNAYDKGRIMMDYFATHVKSWLETNYEPLELETDGYDGILSCTVENSQNYLSFPDTKQFQFITTLTIKEVKQIHNQEDMDLFKSLKSKKITKEK